MVQQSDRCVLSLMLARPLAGSRCHCVDRCVSDSSACRLVGPRTAARRLCSVCPPCLSALHRPTIAHIPQPSSIMSLISKRVAQAVARRTATGVNAMRCTAAALQSATATAAVQSPAQQSHRSFTSSSPAHFQARAPLLSSRPGQTGSLYGHWGFTPEQEELRELVAKFAAAEIAPRAAEIDKLNEFPADLWKKFGDLGLLGITVKEEDGGETTEQRADCAAARRH